MPQKYIFFATRVALGSQKTFYFLTTFMQNKSTTSMQNKKFFAKNF
jgi:hypothetical protein